MSKPEPIPVRVVRYVIPMDGPGQSVASSCSAGPKFAIGFCPWLRHFEITFKPPSEPPQVWYVHETHIKSWEPLGAVEVPVAPVSMRDTATGGRQGAK